MSISASVLNSWAISDSGNSGARSAGVSGSLVPGCSIGGTGFGRSASTLYQVVGIRSSGSKNLVIIGPSRNAWIRRSIGRSHGSGTGADGIGRSGSGFDGS